MYKHLRFLLEYVFVIRWSKIFSLVFISLGLATIFWAVLLADIPYLSLKGEITTRKLRLAPDNSQILVGYSYSYDGKTYSGKDLVPAIYTDQVELGDSVNLLSHPVFKQVSFLGKVPNYFPLFLVGSILYFSGLILGFIKLV